MYGEKIKKKKKFRVLLQEDFIFRFHTYFSIVLLLISSFEIHNLELARCFLLTLKH